MLFFTLLICKCDKVLATTSKVEETLYVRTINTYGSNGMLLSSFEDSISEEDYYSEVSLQPMSDCDEPGFDVCYYIEYKKIYMAYQWNAEKETHEVVLHLAWDRG